MSQLIVLTMVGAVAYGAYRMIAKQRSVVRARATARRANEAAKAQTPKTLKRDPQTGVYRPD